VLIGDHDIKDPTDIEHQERNVTAVIFHEEFTSVTIVRTRLVINQLIIN